MKEKENLMKVIHPFIRNNKIELNLPDIDPDTIQFSIINKPGKRKALFVHSNDNNVDVFPIDETVNEKTLYKTYKDGLLTIKWANKN